MGKRNKTGRRTGEPRFIQIPYWVLETPAALALSGNAVKVLLYLLKRYNGSNNGTIAFGARSGCFKREAFGHDLVDASIGIGPSATSAALYELDKAGFIRCTKASTFDQKRMTREWRLTWLGAGSELPTKEFVTAEGDFRRPKKQNPVRLRALSDKLQCAYAHNGKPKTGNNPPYSAPARTMPNPHSAPTRTHLVTISIPSANADDGLAPEDQFIANAMRTIRDEIVAEVGEA